MRFKSLEVTGFKSFADRTKILFQPGTTAIVGPNGCGKSNISDAIRWVLGEQSAKQIRGERMEDVVFSGTNSRPPMGMAEVTLVVTDLNAGTSSDFGAFDEIQITRRYYRSGESEYLINRIPCRLTDIRELFMDTGMGAKAYSIIGQGNIAAVLNAKPKERRFLFEEAAGITKYKSRKDEALRKLERTRDNLSRVRDIIAEVMRQRNSLNRQAKKAERYKTYLDEIQEIDLHLSSIAYTSMHRNWDKLEEEYGSNKNREAELLSLTANKESSIEDLELEVLDREKSLNEMQEKSHRIEGEISKEENRVEVLTTEISHLNNLSKASNKEILRLEEEISQSRTATDALEEELRTISETIEAKERELTEKEGGLSSLLTLQHQEESALDGEKRKLSELMRQIGIQKNRIENMVREKEGLLELHDGFDSNHAELLNHLSETQGLLSDKTESLSSLKITIEQKQSEQESVLSELEHNQEAFASTQEDISRLREQIGQESSRLATLQELQENLEGYDEGTRSLLQHASNTSEAASLPAFHTLVADIFETDTKFEAAIESAVGSRYQSLVVNGPEDSLQAVTYLKENKIGRGSFIPMEPKKKPMESFEHRDGTGVVGEALSLVRYSEQFSGVAEYLLGDVVVMENLEQAVSLFRANGFHRTLVTLSGEVVDPSGAVEGGLLKKNSQGFISRKREIRELQVSLDTLKSQLTEAEATRERLLNQIAEIKERLAESASSLKALDAERVDLEKEISSVDKEVSHLRERIDGLSNENQNRTTEILSLEESLAGCRHELVQLETDEEDQNGLITSFAERVNHLRQRIDNERRTITEERVDTASIKEKKTSLSSHIENNRKNIENLSDLIQARTREIEEARNRIEQAEQNKGETESTIHSLIDRKEELYQQIAREQEAFETKRSALREAQSELKELRRENENLNRLLNDLEVRRTEISIKMEHLVSKVREKYHVSIEEVVPKYQDQEIDNNEAETRLTDLKAKIDKMGPVNIMAIEEYNELQERFDFLTTQEADLQESVETLMSTIRKINRTSRERFQEAFDAINEKFKIVFTQLFSGGKAELKLEEGADILEAGVEIIAQPPGKKLQHLSLLSGGEKALTAVALIFSGFLVKPSPFCLLDEVDAPLDDANVERYNTMLNQMTGDTQFILITHNKSSMEHANALYGITMQEPGISKMVSVSFNDGHKAKLSA